MDPSPSKRKSPTSTSERKKRKTQSCFAQRFIGQDLKGIEEEDLNKIERLADEGDADALAIIGVRLYFSSEQQQDREDAKMKLETGNSKGSQFAKFVLGTILYGEGLLRGLPILLQVVRSPGGLGTFRTYCHYLKKMITRGHWPRTPVPSYDKICPEVGEGHWQMFDPVPVIHNDPKKVTCDYCAVQIGMFHVNQN